MQTVYSMRNRKQLKKKTYYDKFFNNSSHGEAKPWSAANILLLQVSFFNNKQGSFSGFKSQSLCLQILGFLHYYTPRNLCLLTDKQGVLQSRGVCAARIVPPLEHLTRL